MHLGQRASWYWKAADCVYTLGVPLVAAYRLVDCSRFSPVEVPPIEACPFALYRLVTVPVDPAVAGVARMMFERENPELVWSILRGMQLSKEQWKNSVGRLRQQETHARPEIWFQGCAGVPQYPSGRNR